MEVLLVFGAVFGAFQLGRFLQWLSDAKNALGKRNDRQPRR